MSHGAYHPPRTPGGDIVTKKGTPDLRSLKRKHRERPWYTRLDDEWYEKLDRLLDLPINRDGNTAVAGCTSRADLVEKGFSAFLRIEAVAREMNYRDTDDLITHMIEGFRFLQRQSAAPDWLGIEQSRAVLPSPPAT